MNVLGDYPADRRPVPPEGVSVVQQQMLWQGRQRRFVTVVPKAIASHHRDLQALIVFFHGSRQSPNVVRRFSGYAIEWWAQAIDAIVAYPAGVDHHFNDGRLELPETARRDNVDDVGLAEQLIADTVQRFAPAGNSGTRQRLPVFLGGYSNGAHLVMRILHERPGLADGAALLCASMPTADNRIDALHLATEAAQQWVPTPIFILNGTSDPYSPFGGGIVGIDRESARGACLPALESARYFAQLNGLGDSVLRVDGLSATELRSHPDELAAYSDEPSPTSAQHQRWLPLPADHAISETSRGEGDPADPLVVRHRWQHTYAPVEHVSVIGMGHVLPGSGPLPPEVGPGCAELSTTRLLREFFAPVVAGRTR